MLIEMNRYKIIIKIINRYLSEIFNNLLSFFLIKFIDIRLKFLHILDQPPHIRRQIIPPQISSFNKQRDSIPLKKLDQSK